MNKMNETNKINKINKNLSPKWDNTMYNLICD